LGDLRNSRVGRNLLLRGAGKFFISGKGKGYSHIMRESEGPNHYVGEREKKTNRSLKYRGMKRKRVCYKRRGTRQANSLSYRKAGRRIIEKKFLLREGDSGPRREGAVASKKHFS